MPLEEYEREYFEGLLERYKTNRHDIRRRNMVLSLLAPTSRDIILDLGCGVGNYSYHISETGARMVSVDFSYHAVRLSRAQYNLQCLIQANGCNLPFKDGSFSKIIMIELVEHVENQGLLYCEINRVLKQNGHVLITTSPITSSFFFPLIQKIRKNRLTHAIIKPYDISGGKHVSLQNPKIIKRRLEACGLEVIKETYWNALHMSYFLSRTNIKFLRKIWRVAYILDNCLSSPRFCNDATILAKKVSNLGAKNWPKQSSAALRDIVE